MAMYENLGQFNRHTEKIGRRISEIQALADDRVVYNDQRVKNVESNVSSTIREAYSENSSEDREFRSFTIFTGGVNRRSRLQRGQINYEHQRKFELCIPNAISRLNNLVNLRQERLADGTVCMPCDRFYPDEKHVYCLNCGSRIGSRADNGDAKTLILPTNE
jgi:hypothetical protein